jgi:dihydrolipoamide dehydrogenase
MSDIKATAKGVSGKVGDEKVKADYLLVSIGRKAVSDNLNLPAAGVKTDDRSWIPVDEYCKTNVPNIYAIGDIGGKIWLAHLASAMAFCAVDNICGEHKEFNYDLIPGCIFTSPEIGTIGLSEEQCKERGIDYKVGKFPFAALGKAMAIEETDGMVKIIADSKTDQVLGVHIAGPHATDLVSEAVTAMQLEVTARELGNAIHAHPTLGEAMMEAAHAVHGECAHVPVRKKRK